GTIAARARARTHRAPARRRGGRMDKMPCGGYEPPARRPVPMRWAPMQKAFHRLRMPTKIKPGKGLACVILAAGQGTRMRSARAKVLHEVLGRPLVAYPVELARALGADPVVAVLGHQLDAVEATLVERFGEGIIRVVEQTQRLGTGHALRTALPSLRGTRGIL